MLAPSLMCQIRRLLALSGRHQIAVPAQVIVLAADDDVVVALGAVVLGPDSLSAGHRQVDLPGEQIRHGRTGAAVVLPASDEDSTNRSVCRSAGAAGGQPVIMRIRTRSRRTK